MKNHPHLHHEVSLTPTDLIAGLGGANRELLATCLALFDDSRWQRRLEKLNEQATAELDQLVDRFNDWLDSRNGASPQRLPSPQVDEGAQELSERQRYWRESSLSDDQLRLVLWIQLRVALGLPARLTTTFRGCGFLADDMTARLIHVLDPPGLVNSGRRWLHQRGWLDTGEHATSLGDVVLPVLDELFEQTLQDEKTPPTQEQRREILKQAIASLDEIDAQSHAHLLNETHANRHNDAALRNTLLLGGGLLTFTTSVSAAGFSAYILAAQASAFIPLVSGPGLVSFVSVMSNPITMLGVAGGGGWWFIHSAHEKIKVAVAARVVAMLTLQGKLHGNSGLEGTKRCFSQAPSIPRVEGISASVLQHYQNEWQRLSALPARSGAVPPTEVLNAMGQPMNKRSDLPTDDAELSGETPQSGERPAAAAMATLTVGDILYSVAAVDPTVIAAADFSRVADIGVGLSFAELAEQILDGSDREVLGGISQLKGYVAEKAVAAQLASAGHTVSFPEASNEPGWDLLVDGQEFQVKFHATLSGLRDHFERYDYPVIANTELVDQIPEELADRVFFVDGLSNELVEQVTRESLGAGAEILNPSVISIAGAVGAARGLLAYRRGQLTGKQALEQILLDGMVRMGLAGSGGVVGASVGLMMFGPAGAWVLGAGAPVLSQMLTTRVTEQLRDKVKGDAHRHWEAQAHLELDALQTQVLRSLLWKQDDTESKLLEIPDNLAGGYVGWRLQDDYDFFQECHQRLLRLDSDARPHPEQRLADTLRVMSVCSVHPGIYQPELRAVTARLKERPGLTGLLNDPRLEGLLTQAGDRAGRAWGAVSEKALEKGWKDKADALAQRWKKSKGGRDDAG